MIKRDICDLCGSNSLEIYKIPFRLKGPRLLECKKCGFIFTECVQEFDDVVRLSKEDYEKVKTNFKEYVNKLFYHKRNIHRQILREILKYKNKGLYLDVGGFGGVFADLLKEKKFITYVVELLPEIVEYLKEEGHKAFCGELRDAHFKNEMFDVITYLEVFEHLISPKKEIIEVRRILKKGGILVLEVPNINFQIIKYWIELINNLIFKMPISGLMLDIHFNFFSVKTLSKFLEKNGFEILNVQIRKTVKYPNQALDFFNTSWNICAENLFVLTKINFASAFVLTARKI